MTADHRAVVPRVEAPGRRATVLIADGDARSRQRLRRLLETQDDFDVVGEADTGALALSLAQCLRPDLLLLDERLPSLSSRDFADTLTMELASTRLVILTA